MCAGMAVLVVVGKIESIIMTTYYLLHLASLLFFSGFDCPV